MFHPLNVQKCSFEISNGRCIQFPLISSIWPTTLKYYIYKLKDLRNHYYPYTTFLPEASFGPILSMWVCPYDKSPPIEVNISKFGPKMHLKVPIDFGLDWTWSSVSFLISNLCYSTKLCISYSFVSVCIYLVRPLPVNAPHSTGHRTYTDSYMHVDRVPPWTVKQSSFISPLTDVSQGLSNRCAKTMYVRLCICVSNTYLLLQFCTDYNQTWINSGR